MKLVKESPNAADISKFQVRYALSDWQPNIKHPEDRFAFKAPEGATKRPAPPAPGVDPLMGKAAPALTLDLMGGGHLDLTELKGKKIVILDFWATWCGPCRTALPILDDVAREYKDKDVVLYAVNLREDPERIKAFLKQMKLDVTIALDTKDASRPFMTEQGSIPRTVIVGKDGIVHAAHAGLNPQTFKDELRSELNKLVGGAT